MYYVYKLHLKKDLRESKTIEDLKTVLNCLIDMLPEDDTPEDE